jgi:hypothetical protein
MHNASVVLMGTTQSNDRDVSDYASDPATYKAGLAVRIDLNGLLALPLASGLWAGVSLGKSLSDTTKTSVVRSGLRVPVLLEAGPARQVVTISSYANLVAVSNDTLKIGATTFTFKASASTEAEVGALTNNDTTAANLVTKINAHSVAGLLFKATALANVVTITAKNNDTLGASIDCVYTDAGTATVGLTVADDAITFVGGGISTDYVVIGQKVYFSDTSGKADDPNSAASVSDAVYVSGVLSGLDEAGNSVACAIVDMQGGL